MATLMNANLPSDDEEDQDYVPDEVDEEERRAAKAAKKPKRLRGAAAGAGADAEAEPEGQAPADELDDEDDALPASKREAKKAKVDALWSQLNRKPAATAAARPTSGGSGSLASLCKPARSQGQGGADEAWMRQLGLGYKPKPAAGSAAKGGADKKTVAAAALAAAKAAASAAGAARMGGTITVQEQRRFAGQTITVNKEVAAGSKEAQKAAAEAEAAARKKAGLDAVLASLQQAKKVTVLDKSRADWKDFKKTDDTIEEELEMHKRSGDQYLDKQAFLKDAELREYEKERDRRLASDVRNRGRL
ncbi:hypothetical protein ABPG75_012947 [Micractinium tetrahymenae]